MQAMWLVAVSGPVASGLGESNVLVLYNNASADGLAIANHYQQVHPGSQLLGLDLSGLPNNGLDEQITADQYLATDGLRDQVLDALTSTTDVIVTTKGMPLRIEVTQSNPSSYLDPGGVSRLVLDWEVYSSLESELTRIDTIETWQQMGDQSWFFSPGNPPAPNPANNPYYLEAVGFDFQTYGMRLTSRLDGFTSQNVIDSIDRAQNVCIQLGNPANNAHFVLDDKPSGADRMELLVQNVLTPLTQPFTHDQLAGFIQLPSVPDPFAVDVMGYVGHGTNGGAPVDYLVDPVGGIQFGIGDGAVFHSYESFNAISFDSTFPATQGLVAQWLARGGTVGLGHVEEPGASTNTVTNEDILFTNLLPASGASPGDTGLTWVEAAWTATRQLSFVNTMVGDPLMVWQQHMIGQQCDPADFNLDGYIDSLDLGILLSNFGQVATPQTGELNGVPPVDALDLGILLGDWRPLEDLNLASVAVPEPAPVTLLLIGALVGISLFRQIAGRRWPPQRLTHWSPSVR